MARNSLYRNTAFDLTKTIYTAPQNRLDANRWLNSATFGAANSRTDLSVSTKTSIVPLAGEADDATTLMSMGYSAYVAQQLADNSIPSVKALAGNVGDQTYNGYTNDFRAFFYSQALHGTAQIRLKLAYALSQIFVVYTTSATAGNAQIHYDNLVKSTLSTNTSSFRQLLDDVTYSKAMATMLTYDNNKRDNATTNVHPDQNYAREILQLFTIGLKQLNMDGSVIKDANGIELETYRPQDIVEMAKVFTGLSGDDSSFVRMQETPVYTTTNHSVVSKELFAYPGASTVFIPPMLDDARGLDNPASPTGYVISNVTANTFTVNTIVATTRGSGKPFYYRLDNTFTSTRFDGSVVSTTGSTLATITKTAHGLTNGTIIYSLGIAQESIKIALDYIFNHPNVPPFIAKSLIKFFVTSNPTPQFINRVALKFVNNGNGVRGDLSAVVSAILLDREAIIPFGINPNNHGKYTTLVDRYLRVARAFRSDMVHTSLINTHQSGPGRFSIDFSPTTGVYPYFTKPRNLVDLSSCCLQETGSIKPMESASVFNFFRPGYNPPGTVLGSLGLTGPELQVSSIDSQIVWANSISALCETRKPYDTSNGDPSDATSNDLLDPRGNTPIYGFDFSQPAAGFTITTVNSPNNITVSGVVANTVSTSVNISTRVRRRSDGSQWACSIQRLANSGTQSLTFSMSYKFDSLVTVAFAVGDVFDIFPLSVLGTSGFPSRKALSGGGGVGQQDFSPCSILFHKVAALIPEVSTVPSIADLTPAINYLESILLGRPMSTAIKNLMIQAGQIPITLDTPYISGDASFQNNWLNVVIGYAQKRARHMTAILLASEEFATQR